VKTLHGHFDGKHVALDDLAALKPNTRVKIIALENKPIDKRQPSCRLL
jgi:hypothetical protein